MNHENFTCLGILFKYLFLLVFIFTTSSSLPFTDSSTPSSSLTCSDHCQLDDFISKDIAKSCPAVRKEIFYGHFPKGNDSAGEYYEDKDAKTPEDCSVSCCKRDNCNYAFMIGDNCYLLICQKDPSLCVPISVSLSQWKDKSNLPQMVLIRIPGDTSSCEVGVGPCPNNEECLAINKRSRNGLCKCISGYSRNNFGICSSQDQVDIQSPSPITSSTTTTAAPIKKLEVSVVSKNVTLPENEVKLFAYSVPEEPKDDPYSYEWELISHPSDDSASMGNTFNSVLTLTNLIQGIYAFRVNVKNKDSLGSANATVLVLQEKRANQLPIAIISPNQQTVQLPTSSIVLDASSSSDDDKIIGYKWDLQKGPIEFQLNPANVNSSTLQIENLIPGNYTIKLTVEDSDHATNSALANITVIKSADYPPTAIAGKDVVIYLPQTELTLNGNASTDDKKIVQWEWKAIGDLKAVDMQDSHTPFLKLSHLEEGMYAFELKVFDEAQQSSSSVVHVFVKKPTGNPPKASAENQTVILPISWVVLDSKDSKGDSKIVKWNWTQITGPTNSTIIDGDQPKVNVSGLTKGLYLFQLEIEDEMKLKNSTNVTVTVLQKTNEPPKAAAGGDQTLTLPFTIMQFNGSTSRDDVKITEWLWERHPDSSAAGTILGNSDKTEILQIGNVFSGKYKFTLTVKDEQGLSSQDVATIIVKEDPSIKDFIEIVIGLPISSLTEADRITTLQQMTLLVKDTKLVMDHHPIRSQLNTNYAILFIHGQNEKNETIDGSNLALQLRQKIRQDVGLIHLPIISVDTVLCLDVCSKHGVCKDKPSGRECVCDAFWMENILRRRFGDKERNCDWSKIYVGVFGCLLFFMFLTLVWSLVFLFRRNFKQKKALLENNASSSSSGMGGRRIHQKKQYTLLNDDELELEMRSVDEERDTEDSDSDILFETKRSKKNKNKLPNGTSKGILKYPHPPRRMKT